MDKIATKQYVLPAIQREFVWNSDQICTLFDSVMQGYPFGEFLFWYIEPENSKDYRYYDFVREYHQRDNPHCPDLGTLPKQQMIAVLDGQQRLTAFNIGLRGSMAVKLPRYWWNNDNAFPIKVLALDLLGDQEGDEEGKKYAFEFIEPDKIGIDQEKLWYKVADILDISDITEMHDWIVDYGLEAAKQKRALRVLNRLYKVIHDEHTICYYEEGNQNIDQVLRIFIRRNSGGTMLSYSDLLLSIATSQWKNRDARKEVHQLVDDLNRVGHGLGLSKDFVLKAGLMLTDLPSVRFQVSNFKQDNMAVIETHWDKIREALLETVQLVTSFGFDASSIRAASALLPIAYYLYNNGTPSEDDRARIRRWLIRTILKASGIWGSGLDTLLTALRGVLQEANEAHFPTAEMRRVMAQRGKSLDFSTEEIEDLADMKITDQRIFALLSLLSSFIDVQHHHFHIDHIFPKSRFSPTKLRLAEIDESCFDLFADWANRIGNLQLLEGTVNREKQARLPAEWIENRYADELDRQHYSKLYLLGEIPRNMHGFDEFYKARRERLQHRISELVNVH